MRWLIISGVLFLASLVGTLVAFDLPNEVEQEVSVLNYEHQGRFDYLVHQKASYLFDDIPLETSPETTESTEIPEGPPSVPKYPIEITDRFDMSFTYEFVPDEHKLVSCSSQVEVKAVLHKPDEEPEEVILLPTTTREGRFTVGFSLDASELALSPTTTITADVYTTVETATRPIFESFTQSLTIQSKGPLLEVDRNLGSTQRASFGELSYEQIGKFDYTVRVKSESPWAHITIGPPLPLPPPPPPPPPAPPALSSKTLGPGDTIFPNLLDKVEVTFYYNLASDRSLSQVATDVDITAVLQGSELWSKKFPLLHAKESRSFNVSFPLDVAHYLELLEVIRDETGASAESYSLNIIADVHTVAETQFGLIDEVFNQTLTTTLGEGMLVWSEELDKTQPGSIKQTKLLPNTNKYLGLSLAGVRNLSAAAAGVFFLFLAFSVVRYVRFKPVKPSLSEEEALQVRKKYGELMAEATEHTMTESEKAISLGSIEDLIKVAHELGKPIIHQAPSISQEPHAYYVFDGATRYQYVSLSEEPAAPPQPKPPPTDKT